MHTIDVAIQVSLKRALELGQAEHGIAILSLRTEDVACFTLEEREELALLPCRTDVPSRIASPVLVTYEGPTCFESVEWVPTVEGVRAGLVQRATLRKAQQAQEEARAQKEAQERQAKEERDVAAVLRRWEASGGSDAKDFYVLKGAGFALQEMIQADGVYRIVPWHLPALADLKQRVVAHAQEALAARQARWEAEERAELAEKQAKQDAIVAAGAQFRTWAQESTNPQTKRAAAEGYDIRGAVLRDVIAQLPAPNVQDKHSTSWEERSSPSAEAFTLLDALTEIVKTLRKPECLTVTVSRVQRITTVDEDGNMPSAPLAKQHRTGIVVTLSSVITSDHNLIYLADEAELYAHV
jgi:hypothetical protein